MSLSEAVFTASHDREVGVSADRRTIHHRAGAWSSDYTVPELMKWIAFYARLFEMTGTEQYRADVEVLRAARDLLRKEGVLL